MEAERSTFSALLLVALASFLAGMALGQFQASRSSGHSRIDWPSSVARPRSLQP